MRRPLDVRTSDDVGSHVFFLLFVVKGADHAKKGFTMNKWLMMLCALWCLSDLCYAKNVKILTTPSNAKIYIDGNYAGDGVVTLPKRRNEGFYAIKVELDGYVPLETKISSTDKRSAVSYTLRRDAMYDESNPSDLVNKYFTITISKDLYTINSDGIKNTENVWKLIHQVLLNYFDEIQTTDRASGFVQTPWRIKKFPDIEKACRTRVSIRESNIGGDLTFQIKISSEVASIYGYTRDESFKPVDRILKELEPLISEFQSRLGKLQ